MHWVSRERLWALAPKCASTSILEVIKPARLLGRDRALAWKGPVITVIRHPWDRIVSARYSVFGTKHTEKFDDWMAAHVEDRPPEDIDVHMRPVSWFLYGHRPDIVLRQSRLEEDFAPLAKEFGLDMPRHLNQGPPRPSWQKLDYDFGPLLPLYKEDFRLLGQAGVLVGV